MFDRIASIYILLEDREPALCQLYQHSVVPYRASAAASFGWLLEGAAVLSVSYARLHKQT